MKKRTGRPPIYSVALAARFCARLIAGTSMRELCSEAGMPSRQTVFSWLGDGKHADFADRYARARLLQAHILADETLEIVDNEPDPARARVRFDARRWYAGKLAPSVYGARPQHDVAEAGAVTITTGVVRAGD